MSPKLAVAILASLEVSEFVQGLDMMVIHFEPTAAYLRRGEDALSCL